LLSRQVIYKKQHFTTTSTPCVSEQKKLTMAQESAASQGRAALLRELVVARATRTWNEPLPGENVGEFLTRISEPRVKSAAKTDAPKEVAPEPATVPDEPLPGLPDKVTLEWLTERLGPPSRQYVMPGPGTTREQLRDLWGGPRVKAARPPFCPDEVDPDCAVEKES
jgi:hypothetical protein